MRRRKRSNGTWFPVFGMAAGEDNELVAGRSGGLAVPIAGSPVQEWFPLTTDAPHELTDIALDTEDLANRIGSEYFLRRVVGKFHCQLQPDTGSTQVKVGLGFFVSRADAESVQDPIGASASTQTAFLSYSPLAVTTQREPWIWRRTWVLSNSFQESGSSGTQLSPLSPCSTSHFGSVLDGPHIDAKTMRRVSNDDRLWASVAAVAWPYRDDEDPGELQIVYDLDVRLFGSLRKARNRGVF